VDTASRTGPRGQALRTCTMVARVRRPGARRSGGNGAAWEQQSRDRRPAGARSARAAWCGHRPAIPANSARVQRRYLYLAGEQQRRYLELLAVRRGGHGRLGNRFLGPFPTRYRIGGRRLPRLHRRVRPGPGAAIGECGGRLHGGPRHPGTTEDLARKRDSSEAQLRYCGGTVPQRSRFGARHAAGPYLVAGDQGNHPGAGSVAQAGA